MDAGEAPLQCQVAERDAGQHELAVDSARTTRHDTPRTQAHWATVARQLRELGTSVLALFCRKAHVVGLLLQKLALRRVLTYELFTLLLTIDHALLGHVNLPNL